MIKNKPKDEVKLNTNFLVKYLSMISSASAYLKKKASSLLQ